MTTVEGLSTPECNIIHFFPLLQLTAAYHRDVATRSAP